MKIELLILKDIINSDHALVDSNGAIRDIVIPESEVTDFDDVIKAAEARYLEAYEVEAHYAVDFDIINQDKICTKLYLRHALETKLLDPETRRQIENMLAEH